MLTSSEKTTTPCTAIQQKAAGTSFFRKAAEESFFGEKANPAFFNHPVQAKLSVSHPDDPQEKEADAVADRVMRMADPTPVASDDRKEALHRSMQETGAQGFTIQSGEEASGEISRKEEKEEEKKIHAKTVDNVVAIQAKEDQKDEEQIQPKLYRKVCRSAADREAVIDLEGGSSAEGQGIHRKAISLYHSDVIQRSGRDPPVASVPFEQSLASSKGGGSALPDDTRQFMENRFGADFGGVKIHTGTTAEALSNTINAQAFAHGNDIYFNTGKYSPDTADGGSLLAHELTHTIQQGASKTISPKHKTALAAKSKLYRRQTGAAPPGIKSATSYSKPPEDVPVQRRLPVNDRPKSLREIRKDAFGIDRKEEHLPEDNRQADTQEAGIQPKAGLSNWPVSANGNLQATSAPITNIPPLNASIQARDETKENKKEEEEKPELSVQPAIQPKLSAGFQYASQAETSTATSAANTHPVQSKAEYNEPSSVMETDAATSVISSETDRGPPEVRLKSNAAALIQRSWLSNALNAVGGALGEAADIVANGLDAGKAWILGKIKTYVKYIPGYNILALILQHDPVTQEYVARTGRNILLAGLQLIPAGGLFQAVLGRINAIDDAAAWIDGRIADLNTIVAGIGNSFTQFMNGLQESDVLSPQGVLDRAGKLFSDVIDKVKAFMLRAAEEFLSMIKRIMLRLVVDFVREQIPRLYPLLCVALGHDPVTGADVPRNGHNILYAALDATDEGREQRKQMEETGTLDRVAAWIDRGIAVFSTAYNLLRQAFTNLWSAVTIENLTAPVETFNRIYNDFAVPVTLVRNFLRDLAIEIIRLIKDALLARLRDYARTVRGYFLLSVIIGKDAFTGELVPRTIPNIIRGFMSLMEGGEEQYKQMEQSGAVAKTTQKIEAAVTRLNMTPGYIIQLFTTLWNAFGLQDLAHPGETFARVLARFGEPIGRLINFVIEIVKIVVQAILEIMNFPFDLINNIIAKAMQAFELIKKDPIGFLKNLLAAIKQGFIQFFGNILTHLFNGLKAWFLSEVQAAGIPIPTDFSVTGIIKWLLAVLDITMEKIWKKLEDRIGKPKVDKIRKMIAMAQRIAGAAGEAHAFIEDVQKRGFMAVMIDKVKEQLSNVWELILDSVKSFVMDQIIKKVTVKLLSMLDPTGIMAVVNSAIALYKAIQSFIRYLRQMLEIVNSFVEGTLQIAQGSTKKAADFLEGALGRGIPVVMGFLANQVGLNLSERLKDALALVRAKVDKGLTWVINKVVTIVEKLVSFGKAAVGKVLGWLGYKKDFKTVSGEDHTLSFKGANENADLVMASGELRRYKWHLDNVEKAKIPSNKMTDFNLAKAKLDDLNKLKKEKRKNDDKGADDKSITDLVNGIADLTSKFYIQGNLPVTTIPIYHLGMNNAGFSKGVKVEKLTKIGPGGTAPSANNPTWETLNMRKQGARSFYVRGHLLSHSYHGSGSQWGNLTPMFQNHNTAFEKQVEKKVKEKFEAGGILYFEVVVDYNRSANSNKAAILSAEPDSIKRVKLGKIIDAEAFVPTSVTLVVDEYDITTNQRKMSSILAETNMNDIQNKSYSQYEI